MSPAPSSCCLVCLIALEVANMLIAQDPLLSQHLHGLLDSEFNLLEGFGFHACFKFKHPLGFDIAKNESMKGTSFVCFHIVGTHLQVFKCNLCTTVSDHWLIVKVWPKVMPFFLFNTHWNISERRRCAGMPSILTIGKPDEFMQCTVCGLAWCFMFDLRLKELTMRWDMSPRAARQSKTGSYFRFGEVQ